MSTSARGRQRLQLCAPDVPRLALVDTTVIRVWVPVSMREHSTSSSAPSWTATGCPRCLPGHGYACAGGPSRESAHFTASRKPILDAVESPTCAVDADGRIIWVNRAWEELVRDLVGTDGGIGA